MALAAAMALGAGAQNAAAQKFQLGARAGIGSQNMNFPDGGFEAKSRLGWHLAAVSRIRLVGAGSGIAGIGLFLQPEVVYSQSASKVRYTRSYTEPGSDLVVMGGEDKVRMSTVDVPLLLSLKASIVHVQAGPVFHLMNNFSSKDGHVEMQNPLRSAVGYGVGASVDLVGLTIDGRYYGDFGQLKSNIKDGSTVHNSVKGSVSSWSLGVGVMF